MEIGSFIEMQFPSGKEYYTGENIVRLNSGRCAIYHAFKSLGCKRIWLPVYQCGTVREFLQKKEVEISYYNIDKDFRPILSYVEKDDAVLLVNYFGIISNSEMVNRATGFDNVIIDNCPAFFSHPIERAWNIYSARKFFGVPDGAYAIGDKSASTSEYQQDYSSETSLFMLKRIEYGCEGEVYSERELNENRIDTSDVKHMSRLTRKILDGVDYDSVARKRTENFNYARNLFDSINLIDVSRFLDDTCVPMVYPLMVKEENLINRLLKGKHFQGNWWRYILELPYANEFEKDLSKYMIPITIDQRYGPTELNYIKSIVYGK
jgi:hypothetical protein